jgi:hypothetical protein
MHSFLYSALDIEIPTSPVFESLAPHKILKRFIYILFAFVRLTASAQKDLCITSLKESNQRPLKQRSLSLVLVVLDTGTSKIHQ